MGAVPELPPPVSRPRRLLGRGFGSVASACAPNYVSAVAVVALLIVACRAATPAVDTQTPGGRLYTTNCSTCHGPAGQGVGDFPEIANTTDILGGDYARTVVAEGRNAMPAFGTSLTAQQIKEIVDYVATFED
jgi:mono/diheme cytochrome c family protein